jgi:DNA-binding CsgD family transcriptional regulator
LDISLAGRAAGPAAPQAELDSGVQGPDRSFVGRSAEMRLLHAELSQARAGNPRLVIVEGSAGVGKTALVRRFLAGSGDLRALQATGEEVEALLPYGIVEQLVRAAGVPVPDSLRGLGVPASQAPDPISVGAGLVELLGTLQSGAPVALVIDDAQWADRPSLQALLFALRRLHADRVLALIGARESASGELFEGLHRLVENGRGTRVRLRGLDSPAIRQLAAAMGVGQLSVRATERIREHTQGSPLHVQALLEELPVETLERPADAPLPSPRNFSALVLGRLAACEPEARRLVIAAAVLGLRCRLSVAAELAEVTDVSPALEQSIAARLLEEPHGDVGRGIVAFPHPLVRAALYHDLGPVRRAALHARAAGLVEDAASSLRHRVAAAGPEDTGLTADLIAFARREVARGAWASAADALLSASRLSPPGRDECLLRAVECMLNGGDVAGAVAQATTITDLEPSPRRDYVLGSLAAMTGRTEDAERLLVGAHELCGPGTEGGLVADITAQLGTLILTRGKGSEAATWAALALDAAKEGPLAPNALSCRVAGLAFAGRISEALAAVASLPDPSTSIGEASADGYIGRGYARLIDDDLAGACADLEAISVVFRRRGPAYLAVAALLLLSQAEYRRGAWDDAVHHGELACSIGEDTDQLWLLSAAHFGACAPLAARGEYDAARAHADAARRAAAIVGSEFVGGAFAPMASAHIARACGDDEGVARALEGLPPLAELEVLREPGIVPWQELYADALVNLGQLTEAEAVLVPYETLATARDRKGAMAGAARVHARLDAARGHRDEALTRFAAGLTHLGSLDMPFERALMELEYGSLLRREGRRAAAFTQLRAAHDGFARLSARPFQERCDRELAACGLAPAKRRQVEPNRLTPREVAVARLVASGKSNREIASELVVSVHTVEFHLVNVFGKLGIKSRSALVAAMLAPADQTG